MNAQPAAGSGTHTFANVLAHMHDVRNPSRLGTLQSLLIDTAETFPRLICTSLTMDPDSHLPETYIYEHHLRVAVSMIDGATGRPESLTTQVVCKVAFSWAAKAALSKEAKFYGHPTVVPFYGRETPRYFGLFRTPESARPREPVDEARYKRFVRRFADDCVIDANVLCMVMEHGGSPLPAQIGDEDANLNSLHDQNLHFQ